MYLKFDVGCVEMEKLLVVVDVFIIFYWVGVL